MEGLELEFFVEKKKQVDVDTDGRYFYSDHNMFKIILKIT